jgi:hypothetical protein
LGLGYVGRVRTRNAKGLAFLVIGPRRESGVRFQSLSFGTLLA